jgi:thiosulfate/3-mercaptopyruvate sulfurtransferase
MSIGLTVALAFQAVATNPRLVTVDQLAAKLSDPKLVMFQIGDDNSKEVYTAGHIPGSQFIHPWRELAAPPAEANGLSLELPSPARLDSVLEARGVSNDSWIVLVSAAEYFSPTARVAYTLEYAGLGGRVALLDGGLEAWKAAGKPLSTDVPTPAKGQLTLSLRPELVVTADYLSKHLEDSKVAIIDARDLKFYDGADTRQGRNGHIPSAGSFPFATTIAEGGKFKDVATLGELFKKAGAEPGDQIVTYCHIGQQASLVWFAAKLAGYDAAVYDGSFQDWAKRIELPVVAPAAAKP